MSGNPGSNTANNPQGPAATSTPSVVGMLSFVIAVFRNPARRLHGAANGLTFAD
jgi:hypothetical protein